MASRPEWLQPLGEEEGLGAYLRAVRERLWLVVLAVVVTTGTAIAYVATAEKVYEGEAGILISPVQSDSDTLARVGLTPSIDPVRDIQTQARLITTNEVAARAQRDLEGIPEAGGDPDDLLDKVAAEPIAESNIVGVTAQAGTPENAAAVANAFVNATIELKTDRLHRRIDAELPVLTARLEEDPTTQGLAEEVAELEVLRSAPDPTVQVATEAIPPDVPISPRPLRSIAGGILAGLVIGIGAAFAMRALDPKLRREEQLRRIYRLPILARVPRELRTSKEKPLSPMALSPSSLEAYRTLRSTLTLSESARGSEGRVILVTGTSPSEGKTTTAISLASALAAAGNRVILIEADMRRPAVGKALGLTPEGPGVVSVLLGQKRLEDAVTRMHSQGLNIELLLADYEGDWLSELFTSPATELLLGQARALADYVIIDSPPLVDVVDTLPLAKLADDVLIVARLGTSRLDKLIQLGELLSENGITPVGVTLIATPRPRRGDYQYYAATKNARPAYRSLRDVAEDSTKSRRS